MTTKTTKQTKRTTTKRATKRPSNVHSIAQHTLTPDELFTAPVERLEIPELQKNGKPGVVYLRLLTADEVLSFGEMDKNSPEQREQQFKLVAHALCNPDGTRLITDDSDISLVVNMAAPVFMRILLAITNAATGSDSGAGGVGGNA